MAVRMEVSQEIDRPVGVVFKFYAKDHVRNHPRWDPDIELWRDSDEPIGLESIRELLMNLEQRRISPRMGLPK